MMINITKEELQKIKNIIDKNIANIKITHDWIKCPTGESKIYEDLTFSQYIETSIKGYNVVVSNKGLEIVGKFYDESDNKYYEDDFTYAELGDEVIYGDNYFDIISYSYSKLDDSDDLVVWRFKY